MKINLLNSYISPLQAYERHTNGAVIIDVREEFEFADKGIDLLRVFNFPLSKLSQQHQQIPKKEKIIIVCTVGLCSEKAADILTSNGIKQVSILQGGILAWSDEGLPIYVKPEALPDELSEHTCGCNNH